MPRQNLDPPHYDGVQTLAMKGRHLFSGSRDNTIKKWNFSNHDLEQVRKSSLSLMKTLFQRLLFQRLKIIFTTMLGIE